MIKTWLHHQVTEQGVDFQIRKGLSWSYKTLPLAVWRDANIGSGIKNLLLTWADDANTAVTDSVLRVRSPAFWPKAGNACSCVKERQRKTRSYRTFLWTWHAFQACVVSLKQRMSAPMTNNVLAEVTALPNKSAADLKKMWKTLFSENPPTFNKTYYVKRLAYRLQELPLEKGPSGEFFQGNH